ncbi:MAG: glycine C-acetyltransferase [Actinomycetota bacterium]|nr:glycine C-acetyltransferase [Actinomycetota bacterium]MDK1016333.1 glycine C-acetyltransferase [Actinomycetota bacterium]MDK1026592.1 glycine C-acetyltransferase [Actinomycetota bacterium]MDK1037453.1 glycine C-acetyltransferase [Actinomycetota bacterium]MDK1095887.1 glycine C-acetyltransferase [Actinomycetota bacterium]
MNTRYLQHLAAETDELRDAGLYKAERVLASAQDAVITLDDGTKVINFCANNYLGLANSPRLKEAAAAAVKEHGYGMASVRFICGTQTVHRDLEQEISGFLRTEDTILYSSCWDANGGLFETILGPQDAIISDSLNHASIIDGVRLCKASRFRYRNNDMDDLASKLKEAEAARFKLIATDGVFSMDGVIANLPAICDLAEEHDAMVMVDDSHAVGFIGEHGGGTPDFWGVQNRVGIVTGTFGKALGGASGGYTSGHTEIVDLLRQRSRPYLFSNSLAPMIAATTIEAIGLLRSSGNLRAKLTANAARFRAGMEAAGFTLAGEGHPIIPVMLGDAALATNMANRLLAEGIYVIGFSFPVVPKGEARIRAQMSAAHTPEHIDLAVEAFTKVGRELGVVA